MEISYTMLRSFMACEYMYYLRYVKRIPLAETSASVYGTAVHRAIKLGYENNLSRDDLVKVFRQEWMILASTKDNVIFNHEKDYLNRLNEGQKVVAQYHDKFMKNAPAPKAIELFIGRKDGITLGNHTVVAVFDQIDANDNVIDYKTGVKPSKLQLDLDLQFTIYSYVYRQMFGAEEAGLILRHLGTMKDLTTTRSNDDFDVLLNEVNKIEEKLKSKTFVRSLSRDCANCYFLEHCLGKERKFGRWNRWS